MTEYTEWDARSIATQVLPFEEANEKRRRSGECAGVLSCHGVHRWGTAQDVIP